MNVGIRHCLWSASTLVAIGAFCLFVLVAVLLKAGMLAGIDVTAAGGNSVAVRRVVDMAFPAVAALWTPQASIAYGLTGSLLLWRSGMRLWALAPLAFLLLGLVELGLRLVLERPPLPAMIRSWSPPHEVVVPEEGNLFPSGTAIRSAFFCVFVAVLLWRQGGTIQRLAAVAPILVTVITGFVRVYGPFHWLSNELAGQLLGTSMATLVAGALSKQWVANRKTGR